MGKNEIIIGIGILVILLALAGTGSAFKSGSSGYDCYKCHASQWTSSNIAFYNQSHRYNDTVQNPPSCENCHAGAWSSSDRFNFSLRTGTATYLTSTTCENCHKAKYDDWQGTMHRVMLTDNGTAQAMGLPTPSGFSWANMSYVIVGKPELRYLNESGYLFKRYFSENQTFADYGPRQYTCGTCHTTGYNPTGNQSGLPGIVGTWSEPGIACERCHGPGGNGHQVEANVSEQVCLQCHNGSTRQGPFLSSAHSPPLKAPATCLKCHSPFDYARNTTVTSTTAINVVCANCHNSHNTSDDKYRELFSPAGFDQAAYANVSDAKNSLFNSTASRLLLTGGPTGTMTAGKDVYDILTTPALIPSDIIDNSYPGPITVTGPISEVLCSNCHYEHGLSHIAGVNLTHARLNYPGLGLAPATCTDCHMSGDLKKHSFNVKDETDFPSRTCSRGTECHVTSDQNLNHSRFSVVPVVNEWKASAHNDKEVGINKSRNYNGYYWNNTAGVPNSRQVSCNKCHSPMDWNPVQDSNTANVPLTADFKGITCAVCHNIHDMGDWLKKTGKAYAWYNRDAIPVENATGAITRYKANYSMMANTTELCGNCHANIRLGNTGPGYGTPSTRNPTGIISPHGFPAKDIFVGSWKQTNDFECIDCHMARKITNPTNLTEMVLPDSQKVTGHSFKVNVPILQNETKCLGCHVVGDISTRIEVIMADTQTKWNATNITVMDAMAQINAFTGPKNLSRDLIARAYWNLRLVRSDESWGVHDPVKVSNLLNESSSLANDSLAALGSEEGNLSITSFSPTTSTVIDVLGGPTRTFSITVNQVANVSWQINETEVANETGVTTSSYSNDSAAEGTWNVTAVAENTNGSAMQKWIWIVSPQGEGFTISGFTINSADNLGVPGWTINLTNATMNVSATTAENGMYQF
ncbi:MAG: ammonia-forming cytochrome c nitrite reductase subunit c552, partial [Candidatus Methanoperedens sp.]|nr:ammonia-forming cytochrome c nitrite reductase subunit c552 [Candidatus Methanoperedens sp.]